MLHLLWWEKFRLAHHGWKSDIIIVIVFPPVADILFVLRFKVLRDSRSTTLLDAEEPIPLFWIWYTGCVGRCPSFSNLEGPGAEDCAAVSGGVPGFGPSSLAFMSMMGFSGTDVALPWPLCDGLALKRIQYVQINYKNLEF